MKTLVWNGPFGAFETPPFDAATMQIAKTAAFLTRTASSSQWRAAATRSPRCNAAGVADEFTYVSTAGGAFLEWMEGKALAWRRSAAREIGTPSSFIGET